MRGPSQRFPFMGKKEAMQLTCPDCGLTKAREALSWRLETCPDCRNEGREVYLVNPEAPVSATKPAADLSPLVQRFLGSPNLGS